MKRYHRLEMLWESTRKKGLAGLVRTAGKLGRDFLLGQHRVVFGLYAMTNIDNPTNEDDREFNVTGITSVDTIDEELWLEFSRYRRYIWRDIKAMLDSGRRLWLGYWNGKLACVLWTISGDRQEAYFFPMTDRCTLIAHCVTLPEYRRKGCFTRGLKYVTASLTREGYRRFYVDCSDWNDASRKAIERAGFRRIGRGKCRRRGRLLWYQEATPDIAHLFRVEK